MSKFTILSAISLAALSLAAPTSDAGTAALQERRTLGAYVSLFSDFECSDQTNSGWFYVNQCHKVNDWGFKIDRVYNKHFQVKQYWDDKCEGGEKKVSPHTCSSTLGYSYVKVVDRRQNNKREAEVEEKMQWGAAGYSYSHNFECSRNEAPFYLHDEECVTFDVGTIKLNDIVGSTVQRYFNKDCSGTGFPVTADTCIDMDGFSSLKATAITPVKRMVSWAAMFHAHAHNFECKAPSEKHFLWTDDCWVPEVGTIDLAKLPGGVVVEKFFNKECKGVPFPVEKGKCTDVDGFTGVRARYV